LEDFAEELRSPDRNFNIALEDSAENDLEEMTDRGDLMEQEEKDLSGLIVEV